MICFREESPRDEEAIFNAVTRAFGQSAEAQLIRDLRKAGDLFLSLVAEEDRQIVGHVSLSRMVAPFPALALAPISVIPERQGTGIGSALIQRAVDRARNENCAAIFVLGDTAYYTRFGFSVEAASGFTSPYAGRHFMMLKLLPSAAASTGAVEHAPAFRTLG